MSNDIKQLISSCVQCTKVLPSQPSNPMITPSPSTHFGFPMQHVGLDLFSFGNKEFLICVDHWSGYPFYSHLRSLSTSTVISTLTSWFNLFGWPMSIRSDGGPQFRGEFFRFCETNNIRHELSAPYNPKSNGLAEAGVKSVKNILRKSMSSGEDADRMLYEWRNVPRSDGFSPAQLLFGRAQRTSLPTLASQVTPVDFISAGSSKDAAHLRAGLDHARSKHFLPLLSPGQAVYLQDSKSSAWDKHGVISSIRPDKLSYVVHCDGRYFTRPRRLLRPVHSATPIDASSPTSAVLPPPVLPRRSPRLLSRSPKAHVQFSPSTTSSPLRPPLPTTDSSPVLPSTSASASSHSPSPRPSTSWLPFLSPTVKASSTRLTRRSWSRNTSRSEESPPLLPMPPTFSPRMTQRSIWTPRSPTPQRTSHWINPIMASHWSTSTGPVSPRACLQSWPWSSSASPSPPAATAEAVVNARHVPDTRSSFTPFHQRPSMSVRLPVHNQALIPCHQRLLNSPSSRLQSSRSLASVVILSCNLCPLSGQCFCLCLFPPVFGQIFCLCM